VLRVVDDACDRIVPLQKWLHSSCTAGLYRAPVSSACALLRVDREIAQGSTVVVQEPWLDWPCWRVGFASRGVAAMPMGVMLL
jgi:hypothetical protein